jgi:hypothetical protein
MNQQYVIVMDPRSSSAPSLGLAILFLFDIQLGALSYLENFTL